MKTKLKKPRHSGHKVSSYFMQDICVCISVVPAAPCNLKTAFTTPPSISLHHWHFDIANYSMAGDTAEKGLLTLVT